MGEGEGHNARESPRAAWRALATGMRALVLVSHGTSSCCTRSDTRPTTLSRGHMMHTRPAGTMRENLPRFSTTPIVEVWML